MNGFVVVNKEDGYTSRDVINKLNRIFNIRKMGHTGTLDPLAKGVLVVCIGKYTKLVDRITSLDKEYIAHVKLGVETDTLDITGNIIKEKKFVVDEEKIKEVLSSFIGESMQEVPIYSAVKLNGKKLYEYARNNEKVTLPIRKINISGIKLLDVTPDGFKFIVTVSKGTFIRSLIKDICKKLGTVGCMSDLIRTKQGAFNIENSYTLDEIINNKFKLLSIEDVIDYEVINMSGEEYFKVKNGAKLEKNITNGSYLMKYNDEVIAIYDFLDDIGKIDVML